DVRLVSLQGALVGDPGDAVRYGVVHEQPVLLVLAGVCEVQSVHLHVPAGGGERGLRGEPDHITTEGDDHVPQSGIPADGGAVAGGVHSTGVPVLHGNHPQVGAVTDVDLHGLGERRIATVVEHHDRLGLLLGDDAHVLGGRGGVGAGDGHQRLLAGHVLP